MAYRNQNYMTNVKIKKEVDKNQKGYVPEEESETENPVTYSFKAYEDKGKETELGTGTLSIIQETESGFTKFKILTNDFNNNNIVGQEYYMLTDSDVISGIYSNTGNTNPSSVVTIKSESDYNAELDNPDSALNKYYTKWPREDAIDADGKPIRDSTTEVAGHSWESAITAPTDPAETSTFPWVTLNMNNFTGTILVKYNNELALTWNVEEKSFGILSVPADLGLTDYRLEWGTGAAGTKVFDESLLEVIYIPNNLHMYIELTSSE